MKYYILKIFVKELKEPLLCEINKRTLDHFLGEWQNEGKFYRHNNEDGSGFMVYRENIIAVAWIEIFKDCNQSIHLVKE